MQVLENVLIRNSECNSFEVKKKKKKKEVYVHSQSEEILPSSDSAFVQRGKKTTKQ